MIECCNYLFYLENYVQACTFQSACRNKFYDLLYNLNIYEHVPDSGSTELSNTITADNENNDISDNLSDSSYDCINSEKEYNSD